MNHSARRFIRRALPLLLLALPVLSVAQAARLQMPNLQGIASKAKESVDVQLDAGMLRMAGQFIGSQANGNAADTAAVQEALQGIEGIYVKSYEFETENVYPRDEVDKLRRQLDVPGWNRLVSVHKQDENVDVFLRPGSKDGGLVVIVAQPKELTIVNIVGIVDLAKLAQLGGRFGVPNVMSMVPGGAPGAPTPPTPPAPAPAPAAK